MMSVKIDRIGSSIVKGVSYILATEIKDKDLKFVTVTDCKVTNDLSFAKIYVMVSDDNRKNEILKSLNNASGFIRRELVNHVDIRHIPELTFVYDESISNAQKIEDIIEKINNEEGKNQNIID
ncbi:MAG: 30S ribosome-binding factor RbfA [Bacilli bacterium]|nr:30S ribosome-binding factor RbfA [Bacilli bacterium]MDD4809427.1 30S ribosome-binding factor RbfA [Bacilli bacterium]